MFEGAFISVVVVVIVVVVVVFFGESLISFVFLFSFAGNVDSGSRSLQTRFLVTVKQVRFSNFFFSFFFFFFFNFFLVLLVSITFCRLFLTLCLSLQHQTTWTHGIQVSTTNKKTHFFFFFLVLFFFLWFGFVFRSERQFRQSRE